MSGGGGGWGAERGLFTDSRSTIKKKEERWAGSPENMSYLRRSRGGGGRVERAGGAEGGKTGIQ